MHQASPFSLTKIIMLSADRYQQVVFTLAASGKGDTPGLRTGLKPPQATVC
jgi:hypothetical protein